MLVNIINILVVLILSAAAISAILWIVLGIIWLKMEAQRKKRAQNQEL